MLACSRQIVSLVDEIAYDEHVRITEVTSVLTKTIVNDDARRNAKPRSMFAHSLFMVSGV